MSAAKQFPVSSPQITSPRAASPVTSQPSANAEVVDFQAKKIERNIKALVASVVSWFDRVGGRTKAFKQINSPQNPLKHFKVEDLLTPEQMEVKPGTYTPIQLAVHNDKDPERQFTLRIFPFGKATKKGPTETAIHDHNALCSITVMRSSNPKWNGSAHETLYTTIPEGAVPVAHNELKPGTSRADLTQGREVHQIKNLSTVTQFVMLNLYGYIPEPGRLTPNNKTYEPAPKESWAKAIKAQVAEGTQVARSSL